MITLVSNDDKKCTIDENIIIHFSEIIRNILEDLKETDIPIPLPNVSGKSLELIVDFCNYHHTHPKSYNKLRSDDSIFDGTYDDWDIKMCNRLSVKEKYDLLMSAIYLQIICLQEFIEICFSDTIKEKNILEMAELFVECVPDRLDEVLLEIINERLDKTPEEICKLINRIQYLERITYLQKKLIILKEKVKNDKTMEIIMEHIATLEEDIPENLGIITRAFKEPSIELKEFEKYCIDNDYLNEEYMRIMQEQSKKLY